MPNLKEYFKCYYQMGKNYDRYQVITKCACEIQEQVTDNMDMHSLKDRNKQEPI